MTRSTMRFVDWTITPDYTETAPVPAYVMECKTCPSTAVDRASEPTEDFGDAQSWALRHSGRHPSHTTYRETIVRHWQTTMGGSQ